MLADGKISVLCYVSDASDSQASKVVSLEIIFGYKYGWFRADNGFSLGFTQYQL